MRQRIAVAFVLTVATMVLSSTPARADSILLHQSGALLSGFTEFKKSAPPMSPNVIMDAIVDYAVFAPGALPSSLGYIAPAGDYVYAYQIFNVLNDLSKPAVTVSSMGFTSGAPVAPGSAGQVVETGDVPFKYSFISGESAQFLFMGKATISQGQQSSLLFFASPNAPQMNLSYLFAGGLSQSALLPSPSLLGTDSPPSTPLPAGFAGASFLMLGIFVRRFSKREHFVA